MRELFTLEETVAFAKALSSELRVHMLQYIAIHAGIGFSELADVFSVSRAAITQNIKILLEADLVEIRQNAENSEARKACFIKESRFTIYFSPYFNTRNFYSGEIPIGQYTCYEAKPTCGIATVTELIGKVDDPRYFDDPKRFSAAILWLSTGYIEYRLPNYLQKNQHPVELQLSFEISSEAPGIADNWPSDISFYFNGTALGSWTSPGDFGEAAGLYTPQWWEPNWNQYGLLKLLSINSQGTFIDGLMISPLTLESLQLDFKSDFQFRIEAAKEAKNNGGLTLFGRGFGNYNQDIRFHVIYEVEE